MIQRQCTLSADHRRGIALERLIRRQYAHADMTAMAEIRLAHFLGGAPALHDRPVTHQLRTDGITHCAEIISLVQLHRIAAGRTAHGVAPAGHLIHRIAFGTAIQQRVQFLRHLALAVKAYLPLLIPDIVIVGQQTVHGVFYFPDAHVAKLLGGEHTVHADLNAALALVQTVLGIGQITAGDLGIIHGKAQFLQQLGTARNGRLCHAGNGAHALGHDADIAALLCHTQYLAHGIGVGREVLLGDHLHGRQQPMRGETEKFIIAHHKVQPFGPAGRCGELIVHPGGVVGNHHNGAFLFGRVCIIGKMGMVQAIQNLDYLHQKPIKHLRRCSHIPAAQFFVNG